MQNAADSLRLHEECDLLSLRIDKALLVAVFKIVRHEHTLLALTGLAWSSLKLSIGALDQICPHPAASKIAQAPNLAQFKSCMLASLRSLLPKA